MRGWTTLKGVGITRGESVGITRGESVDAAAGRLLHHQHPRHQLLQRDEDVIIDGDAGNHDGNAAAVGASI